MKIKFWFILFIAYSNITYAQKPFSTYVDLGVGSNFEKSFPNCNKKDVGRITISASQYFDISKNYAIGVEAVASSRFLSFIRFGDGGPCREYDAITNTKIENFNNLNASSILLRGRYALETKKSVKPFMSLGIGLTTYAFNSITYEHRVAKSHAAISPQIGVMINGFSLSCKMIFGGVTPSFEGYDSFSQKNVSLSSIKSQQLYITAGFRLFRF
jgi:hypothetical protein